MSQIVIYTSPKEVDEHAISLLNKLGLSDKKPTQIKVKVENYAKFLRCYYNVEQKINRDGGSITYGWAILNYDFTYEAEHHAVWQSDRGEMIDLTPREDVSFSHIMFVEDNHFIEGTKTIDNVRLNISGNRLIDEYIKICEVITKLTNLGDHNGMYLDVAEAYHFAHRMKDDILSFVKLGGTYKSPCFCGDNKRFKNCHGQMMKYDLDNLSKVFNI